MGQTMNAALLSAIYGTLITPNISKIPGVVSLLMLIDTIPCLEILQGCYPYPDKPFIAMFTHHRLTCWSHA